MALGRHTQQYSDDSMTLNKRCMNGEGCYVAKIGNECQDV